MQSPHIYSSIKPYSTNGWKVDVSGRKVRKTVGGDEAIINSMFLLLNPEKSTDTEYAYFK